MESEFEVVDDIVYEFMIFDKRNDFHFCTAVGTEEGVYLIDFGRNLDPAFGGHMAVLFLNDQRVGGESDSGLMHFSSVGIGVRTVVTNQQPLLSSIIFFCFRKSIFERKYEILAYNISIMERRTERKEIKL